MKSLFKQMSLFVLMFLALGNVSSYGQGTKYNGIYHSTYENQDTVIIKICRDNPYGYNGDTSKLVAKTFNFSDSTFYFWDMQGNRNDTIEAFIDYGVDSTYYLSVYMGWENSHDDTPTVFVFKVRSFEPPYVTSDTTVCSFPITISYDSVPGQIYGNGAEDVHTTWYEFGSWQAISSDTNSVEIDHPGGYRYVFFDQITNCQVEDSVVVHQNQNPTSVLAINFLVNPNPDTSQGTAPVQISLMPIGQQNATSNTWLIENTGGGFMVDTLYGLNPILTFPMSPMNETYKILCVAADTAGGVPIDECNYDTTSISILVFPNGGVDANRNGVLDPDEMPPDNNTGIANLVKINSLHVYPNPASDKINVNVPGSIQSITISSITGRKLIETKDKAINISNLSNGMYLLHVKTLIGNKLSQGTVKFIKK